MKKELTKNKGITLVSLVVTIIVLIILASISINLLLGQNGIMTKAKEAKKAQKMAEVKEKLSLEIASAETDAIVRNENLEQKQLEDIISKYGTLQADGDTIITKDDNYELSLKEIWYGVLSESGSYSDKVTQVEMLEKELEDLQKKYDQLEELNQGNSGILDDLKGQITELEQKLQEAEAKQAEGNAIESQVLAGKTFSSEKGSNLTGTMTDQSGQTIETTNITSDENYTYLSVPSNGYYDTNSKIKIPNSEVNLKENDFQFSDSYTVVQNNDTSLSTFTINSKDEIKYVIIKKLLIIYDVHTGMGAQIDSITISDDRHSAQIKIRGEAWTIGEKINVSVSGTYLTN